MSVFEVLFCAMPVAASTWVHWKKQNHEHLDGAARVIVEHDANPWVFAADERHFEQFATEVDRAALAAMSPLMRAALLDWADD